MSPVAPCVGEAVSWEACAFDADRALELIEGLSAQEREDEAQQTMGSAEESKDAPEMTAEPLNLDFAPNVSRGGRAGAHRRPNRERFVRLGADGEDRCAGSGRPSPKALIRAIVRAASSRSTRRLPQSTRWCPSCLAPRLSEAHGRDTKMMRSPPPSPPWPSSATRRSVRGAREALVLASEAMPMIPLVHPAYAKVASDRVQMANVLPNGLVDLGSVELV